MAATDRLPSFAAELLNLQVDFPLFQRWAPPVTVAKTKIAGIKIQDTRMIRLMEVPRHGGPQLHGWRTTPIHEAILSAFGLSPQAYSLTQLRYDLRKMKSTVWGSAPADPTVTDSPPKASGWRPSSFSSTSASVGLWPTACSTTARSKPQNRPAKSKRLTSKLTTLFRNSSI